MNLQISDSYDMNHWFFQQIICWFNINLVTILSYQSKQSYSNRIFRYWYIRKGGREGGIWKYFEFYISFITPFLVQKVVHLPVLDHRLCSSSAKGMETSRGDWEGKGRVGDCTPPAVAETSMSGKEGWSPSCPDCSSFCSLVFWGGFGVFCVGT